jgi:hypothetical protein
MHWIIKGPVLFLSFVCYLLGGILAWSVGEDPGMW